MSEDTLCRMTHPITPATPPPLIQGALDVLMSIHKPGIGVPLNATANHLEKILPFDKNGLIAPVPIAGIPQIVAARKLANGLFLHCLRIPLTKQRRRSEFVDAAMLQKHPEL